MARVTFMLSFPDTPLVHPVPVKALTSQGKRLDVVARVIQSIATRCIAGVVVFFSNARLDLARDVLEEIAGESELGTATWLGSLVKLHRDQGREGLPRGVCITFFEKKDQVSSEMYFTRHLRDLIADPGIRLVFLHEEGRPIVKNAGPAALCLNPGEIHGKANSRTQARPREFVIVIGNQDGFTPSVEEFLLEKADDVISINKDGMEPVSMLGSQVAWWVGVMQEEGNHSAPVGTSRH